MHHRNTFEKITQLELAVPEAGHTGAKYGGTGSAWCISVDSQML